MPKVSTRIAAVALTASALIGGSGAVAASAVTPPPPAPVVLHCLNGGTYTIPSTVPAAVRAYLVNVLVGNHICHL